MKEMLVGCWVQTIVSWKWFIHLSNNLPSLPPSSLPPSLYPSVHTSTCQTVGDLYFLIINIKCILIFNFNPNRFTVFQQTLLRLQPSPIHDSTYSIIRSC